MCLMALALNAHPRFPCVLAANRDEFFDREALAMDWWRPVPEAPAVLAGRDLSAGGSWFGVESGGRLALLTNIRRPGAYRLGAPTRGALVLRWLTGREDAAGFGAALAAGGYNACNLVVAEGGGWFALSSDDPQPRPLAPGVHGLSNAALDTPWPKVTALKSVLGDALAAADDTGVDVLAETLFAALRNPMPAPDAALPDTGVGLARERELSPLFIRTADGRYGTRCSTVLVTERQPDGSLRTHLIERSFAPGADAAVTAERRFALADWPPLSV